MSKYIDKNGLVCSYKDSGFDEIGNPLSPENPWLDGGDSANRTFAYLIGRILLNEPVPKEEAIRCLEAIELPNSKGNYRRHPDERFWYSGNDRMSRDQSIPVVVAMGMFGLKKQLLQYLGRHMVRLMLFTTNTRRNGTTAENHGQKHSHRAPRLEIRDRFILDNKIPILSTPKGWRNYNRKLPDFTGPEFWALYIRGFRFWPLYPLLLVFDLVLLISAIVNRRQKDKTDVINFCIMSVFAVKSMPTPFSYVANKYVNDPEDLAERVRIFYYEPKLMPELWIIWQKVVKKYFGGKK